MYQYLQSNVCSATTVASGQLTFIHEQGSLAGPLIEKWSLNRIAHGYQGARGVSLSKTSDRHIIASTTNIKLSRLIQTYKLLSGNFVSASL